MLYGIISDLHSNLEAFDAVIEYAESLGVQKYISEEMMFFFLLRNIETLCIF